MYFVLKSLKFIYIIPLYMFRTPLCPSSGASQMHMQSLVPINYKNTCCLKICHYVHFIITTNYLCDTYKPFFKLYVGFYVVLFLVVAFIFPKQLPIQVAYYTVLLNTCYLHLLSLINRKMT